MPFDLKVSNQCEDIEQYLKAGIYKKLHEHSDSGWVKLTGLPVGIVCSLLTVAKRIGCIVESIFKGLINIFGSICCIKQCSVKNGLRQILLLTPKHIFILPISVVTALWDLVQIPVRVAFDTKDFTHSKWIEHDADEKAREAEVVAKFERNEQNRKSEDFKNIKKLVDEHETNNLDASQYAPYAKLIGEYYEKGIGTEKNLQQAAAYYAKAGDAGCTVSMYRVALLYKDSNPQLSIQWAKRAADLGHIEARDLHRVLLQSAVVQELDKNHAAETQMLDDLKKRADKSLEDFQDRIQEAQRDSSVTAAEIRERLQKAKADISSHRKQFSNVESESKS